MLGRSLFSEAWFQWGAILVIGFPLSAILLGEIIRRLERRNNRFVRPVRLLRNVFLPLAVAVLFMQRVLELRSGDSPSMVVQVAGTLAAVLGLAVLLSLVREFLTAGGEYNLFSQAPRLLVDIARVALLFVGSLAILSMIWGLSITGTFAALGLGGLVFGLAMQDTLASLMGGIAILSEKPFVVGDWIDIDGVEGKVTDINWRTVRIRNRQEDLIVVPNIVFGTKLIINNSRPELDHIEVVNLGFSYDDPPNKVRAMLTEVIRGTPHLVPESEVDIRCVSYDDFSIGYQVYLRMESFDIMPTVRSHFMTRIWYAAKRHEITIPFPIRTLHNYDAGALPTEEQPELVQRRVRALSGSTIPESVAETLANEQLLSEETDRTTDANHILTFAAGELLQVEGGGSRGLGLILSGTAVGLNKANEVVTLTKGEVFGEQSMLGTKPNLLTIRALTDVEAVIISGTAVDNIARVNITFADEIQGIVQSRRAAVSRIKPADSPEEPNGAKPTSRRSRS
ncbi:MAG: mechanosensitive ion channel [Acidimicrobiales bacterium]|nr:mechanosensitive ion channel [Acidimicrobiales bacterium]